MELKELEQKLNPKHVRFCREYIKDYNGTRAYRATYPSCKKDTTAGSNSHRLLKNAEIKAYIKAIEQNFLQELNINRFRNAREARNIGYTNVADLKDGWDT